MRFASLIVTACCLSACTQQPPPHLAAASGDDGWRDMFPVNRSQLRSEGASSWWSLQPGARWTYRNDDEILVVTVLSETEVVDGVRTRIVEERETRNGALKEVSRNYFAIDASNGDVYYFGEDVDIYANGRITGHDGAWRSGVNGARFGLFLPGTPVRGMRFYQEYAPGAALDRVEVVSTGDQVSTPSGRYSGCLHILETTPLEKGESHRWFAPGVGMIRDGDLLLTEHRPAIPGGAERP